MIIDAQDRDGNGMNSSCFLTVHAVLVIALLLVTYNWVSETYYLNFFTMYELYEVF